MWPLRRRARNECASPQEVRQSAMAYAVQTAEIGEAVGLILARAELYSDFILAAGISHPRRDDLTERAQRA